MQINNYNTYNVILMINNNENINTNIDNNKCSDEVLMHLRPPRKINNNTIENKLENYINGNHKYFHKYFCLYYLGTLWTTEKSTTI
jgi:hypothetical protein